jgi:hypothetical protein
MAIGMTTILTSVIEILFRWAETGEIRKECDQRPAILFVDCANGVDPRLRALAEQSLDDFMRRIERFPVILMALRLLDRGARYDPKIKGLQIRTRPYATDWLNLLGELLFEGREEAKAILYDLASKAQVLAEKLQEDYPEVSKILRNDQSQPSPVWRLAESLTSLQGRKNTQSNLITLFDSLLLISRPNGIALKRAVRRNVAAESGRRRSELRSLVFTDSALDYLVHLHVLRCGNKVGYRPLSFKQFIQILHDRYGFCIDAPPPGMTISNDLLRANRAILERRLRDLGLLVGVNDAEAMKHLKPRFERPMEDEHGVD